MSGDTSPDALDLDEQDIIDTPDDAPDDGGDAHEPDDGGDDDLVTFGDEQPQPRGSDSDLVKHLRQQLKDRDRRLAESARPAAEEPIVVGDKPTIISCDYDEDRFEAEREAWETRRTAAAEQERRRDEAKRRDGEAWTAVATNYATRKAALRFADKDEAEETAFAALSAVQQAVIAKVADDPALFVYGVGRSPARLAELAKIDDPLALVKAVTKMEAMLKVTKKGGRAPEPEEVERGRAPSSGVDKQLAKLEAQADRTGDRTALLNYRRSKAAK